MGVLASLGMLAVWILVIVYVVRSILWLRVAHDQASDPHWYVHPFLSYEDVLGQLLVATGITLAVASGAVVSARFGLGVRADVWLFAGTLASFLLAWRLRAPALVVLGVAGLFGFAGSSAWLWVKAADAGGVAVPVMLGVAGVGMMAASRIADGHREEGRRFGFFGWLFSMLGVAIWLFGMSSLEGVALLGQLRQGSPFVASVPLAVFVGAGLALAAGAIVGAAYLKRASVGESIGLGVLWLVLLALAIRPPVHTEASGAALFSGTAPQLTAEGTVWAVVLNVVLLAALLGLVLLGYERREDWLVNLGAALLFVFVLVKYFDWLFTFLDRSIAFVVAGVLLLGVGAAMERGRRYVIDAMEAEDAGSA